MLRLMVTYQADRIALRIFDKRHPFVCARGSETVIAMAEDDLRLSDDLHTFSTQGFERLSHIVDLEIDERARRGLLQQQAYPACLEEQQPWRVEDPGGLGVEQALVESPRPRKVISMLCYLQDVHVSEFRTDEPLSW
jgi:hypothetical protein